MVPRKALLVFLWFSVAATFVGECDARSPRRLRSTHQQRHGQTLRQFQRSTQTQQMNIMGPWKKQLQPEKRLEIYTSSDPYYVGSPFSMPPYADVVGSPAPSSSSASGEPLYCVNPPPGAQQPPPSTGLPAPVVYPPQSPSLSPPTPSLPGYSSPPVVIIPSPPEYIPSPPEYTLTPNPPSTEQPPNPPTYEPSPPPAGNVPSPVVVLPSPPAYVPSPPEAIVPSPPSYVPSPPESLPSPTGYLPSPPGYYAPTPPEYSVPSPPVYSYVPSPPEYVFEPPIVYPPPSVPPPPQSVVPNALWCVAKPTVPDPIIQEAMNYACGSGADCDSIQPNGSCYQPDTIIHHASYAFNSYWQRTRAAGGTCDFGRTAMLVTKDPSVDGCHFITIALQEIDGGE